MARDSVNRQVHALVGTRPWPLLKPSPQFPGFILAPVPVPVIPFLCFRFDALVLFLVPNL